MNTDIPSWTELNERECLQKLASDVLPNGLIVEIGALYGGVTSVMALANPKAKIISIDNFSWTPEGYPTPSKKLMQKSLQDLSITNSEIIEGDSREIGKTWGKPIDLLWIDGGHSIQFVLSDLRNFGVKSEVIALHDYDNPFWSSIHEAVDIFLEENANFEVSEIVGTVCVLRKK